MRMLEVRTASFGRIFMVGFLFTNVVCSADENGKFDRAAAAARSEWLKAPSIQGSVTTPDATARRELLKWLDDYQGDEFRQSYKTTIPQVRTGFPDDYDVAI